MKKTTARTTVSVRSLRRFSLLSATYTNFLKMSRFVLVVVVVVVDAMSEQSE